MGGGGAAARTAVTIVGEDERLRRYGAFLAENGLRLTLGRIAVAEAAFRLGPQVEPQELLRELARDPVGSRVGRATALRALAQLQTLGLIDVLPRE